MAVTSVQEALAWVTDTRAIHLFMQAPYHGHLTSRGNTRFFYDKQPLCGLTEPLRECFWPQEASAVARKRFYARDPVRLVKAKPKPKRPAPRTKPTVWGKQSFFNPVRPLPLSGVHKPPRTGKTKPTTSAIKTKKPRPGIKALKHGSTVHREIDQVVKLGVNGFLDQHKTFDQDTLAVIFALHDFDIELRILYTEYLAGCPILGIGTRIDQVCVDKQGRIYIVETKTGSSTTHRWSGHNGQMRGALEHMGNSAHNRAKVQAMLGAMMAVLGTELAIGGQVRCLVAHVHGGRVHLELIPDIVVSTVGPMAYRALMTHQAKRKYKQNMKNMKQEHV